MYIHLFLLQFRGNFGRTAVHANRLPRNKVREPANGSSQIRVIGDCSSSDIRDYLSTVVCAAPPALRTCNAPCLGVRSVFISSNSVENPDPFA